MGHGESLRLIDLLGWTIPTASRTGLDHGRRFGGSISGAEMTLLQLLRAMQILFLTSSCIKGDPQIPVRKGRPHQQECFIPRNIRLYRYPVCSLSCQRRQTPFQIQHFLRPDGIRKAIYNVLSLATLEKRNQSYDHAFRCALR